MIRGIRGFFLSLLFLPLPVVLSAQQATIDSLARELRRSKPDSGRVHILNALSYERAGTAPERALQHAADAKSLAQKLGFRHGLAEAYYHLGDAYATTDSIDKAEECFQTSLESARECNSGKVVALALYGLGRVENARGRRENALRRYMESLEFSETIRFDAGSMTAAGAIGTLHQEDGALAKAGEYFERSLQAAERMHAAADIAWALRRVAWIELMSGHYDRAMALSRRSLSIHESDRDSTGLAMTLYQIANIHDSKGQLDSAMICWTQALRIYELLRDNRGVAEMWNSIGQLYSKKGDLQKAEEYLQKSIRLFTELGDRDKSLNPLASMSRVYMLQGQTGKAILNMYRVLESFQAMKDHYKTAQAYSLLAAAMYAAARYDSAIICGKLGLDLAERCGYMDLVATLVVNIGSSYYQSGMQDSAIVIYERGITIAERQGDNGALYALHNNMGKIHFEKGDLDIAMQHFMQSLSIQEETGYGFAGAAIRSNIGQILARQGMHEKALEYFHKSLNQAPRSSRMSTLVNMGGAHRAMGEKDKALQCYIDALDIAEILNAKSEKIKILGNIGEMHRLGDRPDSASSCFNRGLAIAREIRDRESEAMLLQSLSRLQRENNRYDSSIVLLHQAYRLARDLKSKELLKNISFDLGQNYALRGDTSNSNMYFATYLTVSDSMNSEANRKIISELNTRYEVAQREKAITILEKDKLLQEMEIKRQQERLHISELEMLQQSQALQLLSREKEIQKLALDRRTAEAERARIASAHNKTRVALLTKDNLLQASLLERGTLIRNTMTGGLFAVLLLTGVISYRYRERKRMNVALSSTLDELRRTQKRLIHAEKMASLGQLTTGIAHEIKNPLNFINNFSTSSIELFDEYEETDDEIEKQELRGMIGQNLQKIAEHGKRADAIVRGMMLHADAEANKKDSTDLHGLLDEAMASALRTMMAKNPAFSVQVEKRYHPSVPRVDLFAKEMNRALQNVIDNALYAMCKKAISLDTSDDPPYTAVLLLDTERTEKAVRIRVRDNGTGIPEAVRDRIFQPFFTTRPAGEGTGLGLALGYEIIVNGHAGQISVDSCEGEFTEIEIVLPV